MKSKGKFGEYGGMYVPEALMPVLGELETAYLKYKDDPDFIREYEYYLREYVGRPNPLYYAKKMTEELGGAKIYLKREDLNHTGAHKINNVIGQILLAKRMGKKKVIAETGAGQHGVATATFAALSSMECTVFMGEKDIKRQKLNVFKMKLLGAEVISVKSGTKTLKDASNEAIRQWVARAEDTFYVIGSVIGPHPYPGMVRDFQKIIGIETKQQILEKENKLPNSIIACVGGGSNAIGIFYNFLKDDGVKLTGVEAAGKGTNTKFHAATLEKGSIGVLHGMKTYFLQDDNGNINEAHSISAGLDYPGIGPEHAFLFDKDRVEYVSVTDDEAVKAFGFLSKCEGIIPALESSHAIAHAMRVIPKMDNDDIVIINISGRGDKDVENIMDIMKGESHE